MTIAKSILLTTLLAGAAMAVTSGAQALTREEARERAAATRAAAKPAPAKPIAAEPDPTAPWQVRFDAMDTTGDGSLTLDEARAHAEKVFKAMDTDHDGKVTAPEFINAHTPKAIPGIAAQKSDRATLSAGATLGKVDTNHDGVLSLEEWKAANDAYFAKADVNKRGTLFRWEFRRFPW